MAWVESSLPEVEARDQLVVAVDPLDGSSNLDCAAPTGTIFGIWARNGTEAFAQPGSALLAAGYVRPLVSGAALYYSRGFYSPGKLTC